MIGLAVLLVLVIVQVMASATIGARPVLGHPEVSVSPSTVNDTAVTAGNAAPRSASVGTPVNITATIQNRGDATVTVRVNASAGSREVGVRDVDLPVNASRSVWFIWDTSPDFPGSYNITIAATPLPGETNLTNNLFNAGKVVLTPRTLRVHASATPTATDVGLPVSFACQASDGAEPYRYLWDFGDDRTDRNATSVKAPRKTGVWTVSCTVTDNATSRATDTVVVNVAPVPRVFAKPDRFFASPNTTLTFTAFAIGGTGGITYTWGFGDGATGTGGQVKHTYVAARQYTVTVRATDSVQGYYQGTGEDSFVVTIAPLVVTATQTATRIKTGEFVVFSAFASGGFGGPYSFLWDFGDGTPADNKPTVSHSYASAKNYSITVTVSDGNGDSTRFVLTLEVTGMPTTPSSGPPFFEAGIGLAAAIAVAVGSVSAFRRRQRRRRWGPRPR